MFAEQTVWITGASSGIGAALARTWAATGASLILSGRRRDALEQVAAACAPAQCFVLPFEATDFGAIPALVAQAIAWKGRVDILVNNAGISQRSLAVDTELATYQRLMDVDYFGPVALTQQLLPHFVQRGSGRVVQIASVAGKVGVPLRSGYCAAKHALIGYSDALRAELAPHGVQVHVVIPGFVRTEIAKNAIRAGQDVGGEDPVDSGMDPGRAAAAILRGIQRGSAEIPVGEGKEMAALWLRRLWPGLLFRKVALGAKP